MRRCKREHDRFALRRLLLLDLPLLSNRLTKIMAEAKSVGPK